MKYGITSDKKREDNQCKANYYIKISVNFKAFRQNELTL